MSQVPNHLKYTSTHEWARRESNGTITVGITDHAQALLGDVVFIELPEVDAHINVQGEAGVVESVKAASDIYSPINGTIIAVNHVLIDTPEVVNSDPYGEGWLFQIKPSNNEEWENLLDASSYLEKIAAEEH